MKRNYILFQILLIIAGLTFYSCSVETKSLSTEQAYAELKLPEEPDSLQIHAIVQASRIWGFAKYHHPAFASRSINADAEYFCLLNEVLQAPDSMKNDICLKWISGLGPYAIRDKEDDENIETFNDFNWISDSLHLGKALSDSLMRLRNADPENNRYVKQTPVNVSYIETQYSDIPKDDVAYRLLGVAKFWNAVDSYSPNRNLTDRPWDDVLAEYIALAFDRSISFSALYSRMVSELCDTHVNSWYVPIFGGRFVPLMCQFAEDRLFVTDTCSLVPNNFEIGDEIILCMQEIQLDFAHRELIIPATPTPNPLGKSNLIGTDNELLQLKTVDATTGHPLYFLFDTGFYYTNMEPTWYNRHRQEVDAAGVPDSLRVAGIGGVAITRTYRLPQMKIQIGNGTATIDSIKVNTGIDLHTGQPKTTAFSNGAEDGVLGLNALEKFSKVILNLKDMYMEAIPFAEKQ